MATIRVTREAGRSVDRRRAYRVVVDDTEVGGLQRGETKDFPLGPGTHVVRVSIDAQTSRAWETSLGEGDVVSLVCRSRRKSDTHVDLFLPTSTARCNNWTTCDLLPPRPQGL